MKRRIALAALAGAALQAAGHPAGQQRSSAQLMDALMWGRETPGGPFQLVDHNGHPRSDADYRGRFLLVSFGFTSCSDACPAQLHEIAQLLALLGPHAHRMQALFITLDPARDTPHRLSAYLQKFDRAIVGLTGSAAAIHRVADAYLMSYRKVAAPDGGYGIDHASFVFLMDPRGRYVGFFPPATDAARMRQVIEPLLKIA